MSSMMVATRATKRKTERLPEDRSIGKLAKKSEKKTTRKKDEVPRIEEVVDEDEGQLEVEDENMEIPYAFVRPLPVVSRVREEESRMEAVEVKEVSYENHAPLQADDRAKELVKEMLRNPINITAEDLLNISEPARQELKKLLTKKRLEKKAVTLVSEAKEDHQQEEVMIEKLPDVSYEILREETKGMPKGSLVIGDPVVQYLSTLQPGERPKKVIAAKESQGLRAVYPLINGAGEVESLLDSGSQIISMAKDIAISLEVTWDPDIVVHMQSANRALEQTLGLAKNVPFMFGEIMVYLQVHILEEPVYRVLLGRPFDVITESLVKNEKDGSQTLTLTDPNTGERCVMATHERGKQPKILKKPVKPDFQYTSMN